jgi:hypothetical protein
MDGAEVTKLERVSMIQATADQLALCSGRDSPNESDLEMASALVQRWDQERILAGLQVWV